MNEEANTALDAWENAGADAALREGWILSETSHDTIECQRIDDPDAWCEDGLDFMPPKLASEAEAWRIVIMGTQPHHIQARKLLAEHSPKEWDAMRAHHFMENTR
jgi:hypothetical protein